MEKKEFLDRLRANTREQYDMPDMNINGITYPDTVKQFIEMTQSVGGSVVEGHCLRRYYKTIHRNV